MRNKIKLRNRFTNHKIFEKLLQTDVNIFLKRKLKKIKHKNFYWSGRNPEKK